MGKGRKTNKGRRNGRQREPKGGNKEENGRKGCQRERKVASRKIKSEEAERGGQTARKRAAGRHTNFSTAPSQGGRRFCRC